MSIPLRMKTFFCFVVAVLTLGACLKLQATNRNNQHGRTPFNVMSQPYKVYKIKSLKNLYLIYARRGDSTFQIVSRKDEQVACKNIKVGKSYHFRLHSSFGDKSSPLYTPRSNRLLVTHVDFYGTSVPLESASRSDLYTADSLSGLCLRTDTN